MLDWIYANTDAHNQADISRRSGVNEVTISRVLNGKVKRVKQETLRKINTGFGNIFNPAWLRGDSVVMLAADAGSEPTSVSTDMRTFHAPAPHTPAAVHNRHEEGIYPADTNRLFNSVISAKDEAIMALKRELSAKDTTIAILREQLDGRMTMMQSIQQQSEDLANKYETLLQEHSKLLHHINVKIDTSNDSHLSIVAESPTTSYEKNGQ